MSSFLSFNLLGLGCGDFKSSFVNHTSRAPSINSCTIVIKVKALLSYQCLHDVLALFQCSQSSHADVVLRKTGFILPRSIRDVIKTLLVSLRLHDRL